MIVPHLLDANGNQIIDYYVLSTPLDFEMFERLPLEQRHSAVFFYLACKVEFLQVIPFANSPNTNLYRAVYDRAHGHLGADSSELTRLVRWLNHTGFFEAFCFREGNPLFTTGEAVPYFLFTGAYEQLHTDDAATIEPYVNIATHPVDRN